jgi:hypothetical protein
MYISTNIMFLGITHSPLLTQNTVMFILQNNVSEAGVRLRLQVKPIRLRSIDRTSPHLRTIVAASS